MPDTTAEEKHLRLAVFGAGGVGGYFGGLLAHAGHDVHFIARGDHLRAMQLHGLQVRSPHGNFLVHPVPATGTPEDIGPVAYLIVALKHYHLEASVHRMRPLVDPLTTVVPLLNGVTAHEILAEALGREHVIGGLSSIVSMIESPGVIRQESQLRRVELGELDGSPSERIERLVRAWQETGVDGLHAEDIHAAMWSKFLFIASFGGVSALSRANAGQILALPETRDIFHQAMTEVATLAIARGIRLPEDAVDQGMAMLEGFEATATSSMQRDVQAGRPFELEAFSGTIARMSASLGIATPVHSAMYALLRPALDRAIGRRHPV